MLLAGKYGHQIHVWDLDKRRHKQTLDLGAEQQLVFELRPARNPTRVYGFAGVVISLKDLSSSIWLWYKDGSDWKTRKVIEIPAEAADPELLPPVFKGFGAAPPLVTDVNLSLDDRYLYVSCWGSGEFRQYDVTDPFQPRLNSVVRMGGMVSRAPHPSKPGVPQNGGPQMVEVSRDGRRVYVTNSLYAPVDAQIYPDGVKGWMTKVDVDPVTGVMSVDPDFFPEFDGMRPHQTRLEGGDASSDSYCYA
jgi:selenium-binding protein 1